MKGGRASSGIGELVARPRFQEPMFLAMALMSFAVVALPGQIDHLRTVGRVVGQRQRSGKGPAEIGEEYTLIVQLLFAPTLGLQLSVSTKPALADIALNFTGARPGLLTVTVCGALMVPAL